MRLRAELGPNLSAIAAGARLSRSSARTYLGRAAAVGLDAVAADGLLEAALFPAPLVVDSANAGGAGAGRS